MKRANSTGSVYKLSGKRRRPWTARVTTGWKDNGQPVYRFLGYYETRKEANEALNQFLYVPEKPASVSVSEAYERWFKEARVKESTKAAYLSAFKRMEKVHSVMMDSLTLDQMQECADQKPNTYATASAVRKLFTALFDWAIAHDYCPEGRQKLVGYIRVPERPKPIKNIFTDDEIQECFDRHDLLPIILIFSGLRRSELLGLQRDDIDLDKQTIRIRSSKTASGLRLVPIPTGLIPYWQEWKEKESFGRTRSYLMTLWTSNVCSHHTFHECRHTYISILQSSGVDERVVKTLCGHSGGVTLDVYTHYQQSELINVVNKAFAKYLPVIGEDPWSIHTYLS